VPRAFKPQCPHCKGFLRDRLHPPLPVGFVLGLIGAVLAAQAFLPVAYAKWALATLMLVYLVAHFRAGERKVPAQHRYTKDGPASDGTGR
jgi:hypothetical protein